MRVSISPNGSVIDMSVSSLPARLDHAGDLAGRGEFAQGNARKLELAIGAARPSGERAAIAYARRRGVARQLGELELRGETLLLGGVAVAGYGLQAGALAGQLLRHPLAARILVDRALLCHWLSPST